MKEELLHYAWRIRRLDFKNLRTTAGDEITILKFGNYNTDAGPDFLEAVVEINGQKWAGSIEMHTKASDWKRHNHTGDPNYENVILHVVYEADQVIQYSAGQEIPCLELEGRIDNRLINTYDQLVHNVNWIPCQAHIGQVDDYVKKSWMENLAIERLETRIVKWELLKNDHSLSWQQLLFVMISRCFGLRTNAEAFETLARSIPIEVLDKHRDSLFQVEAILYGQANLLDSNYKDEYPKKLLQEFRFLQHKYNLKPVSKVLWKFARMRPANFPTIRIAQLAQLLHSSPDLLKNISIDTASDTSDIAKNIQASEYWSSHFVFDKESVVKTKKIGSKRIELVLINAIIPYLFLHSKYSQQEDYQEKILDLLRGIKSEQNIIIRKWSEIGISSDSAFESQALIQLKKFYCDEKRCLSCQIGHKVLSFIDG